MGLNPTKVSNFLWKRADLGELSCFASQESDTSRRILTEARFSFCAILPLSLNQDCGVFGGWPYLAYQYIMKMVSHTHQLEPCPIPMSFRVESNQSLTIRTVPAVVTVTLAWLQVNLQGVYGGGGGGDLDPLQVS